MPSEYDELSVRLSDGKCLYGVVVWSRQSMLGIAFDTSLPDAEDIVWIENRGPEWWRRAARVWDKRRD